MQTDEQIMQIFQDLREIYQTARQHNAESVNQGEKQVLHYLCQTGGQAQPGEISRAITFRPHAWRRLWAALHARGRSCASRSAMTGVACRFG